VMAQLNVTIGVLLLGYLDDSSAVGQFSVAQKIPLALLGIVQLWSATLYPQAAQLVEHQRDELRRRISLYMSLALSLGLPLAAGAALLGPDLIPVLFGDDYGPAGDAFPIVVASLALALLTVNTGSVLAAGGQDRRYAAGRTLSAATTLLAGLVLISAWGLLGAATAMVIGEAVALGYMTRSYQRLVGPVGMDWGRGARALAATAVMCGLLVAMGDAVPVIARLGIAIGAWTAAGALVGVVRRDELRGLRRAETETS
jgi:O-antigen/teichoic acid export membrane protein